jgi:hypothetical protein
MPVAAMTMLDVIRNTSGNMRAIRKADMLIIDSVNRNWQSMTGVTEIQNFMYDVREPNTFYVYPPAAIAGASVEVLYAAYPTDVPAPTAPGLAYTTVTGNPTVNDQWGAALYNYMMGRAYSKDSEFGGNTALAAAYLGVFASLIGTQASASATAAPTA